MKSRLSLAGVTIVKSMEALPVAQMPFMTNLSNNSRMSPLARKHSQLSDSTTRQEGLKVRLRSTNENSFK